MIKKSSQVFVLYLLFCLVIVACSKNPDIPDNASGSGSISYKVNGNLVTMDNANIMSGEGVVFAKQLKGSLIQDTRYLLNAQKGANNAVTFTITTDSLQKQTYHIDSIAIRESAVQNVGALMFDGQFSGIFFSGDVFDVKITSYTNARISGTFSGKFTSYGTVGSLPDYNNKGTIIITDGRLNNVPVTY